MRVLSGWGIGEKDMKKRSCLWLGFWGVGTLREAVGMRKRRRGLRDLYGSVTLRNGAQREAREVGESACWGRAHVERGLVFGLGNLGKGRVR